MRRKETRGRTTMKGNYAGSLKPRTCSEEILRPGANHGCAARARVRMRNRVHGIGRVATIGLVGTVRTRAPSSLPSSSS
ncbi:hypothetical protein PUN28_016647 [Cardiocondyla obscurior]|uniref:Uncharacterized protein n=1 Tax=Cardiocondyla obscurior TaxID=286306 RepID=A0AAW2EPA4_9HYME